MTDTTTMQRDAERRARIESAPALSAADLDYLRRLLAPARKLTRSDVALAA